MPILWLPHQAAPRDEGPARQDAGAPFLVLQLGYADLFRTPTTWAAVRERLERYSLRSVLEIVSRISAILQSGDDGGRAPETQQVITGGLFGPNAPRIWQALEDRSRELGQPAVAVLFGELQLINVVKVAFLLMPVEDRASAEELSQLGEAFLMINDLMWAELEPDVPPGAGGPMPPEWQQMILANQLFHAGGSWRNDLARSYDLYLTDRPHLRGDPAYIDLPERVRTLVGIDRRSLWTILFAFYSHWGTINRENLHQVRGGLNRATYFSANYRFTGDEVDGFFRLCCSDVAEVQAAVRERYALTRLDPLDNLPLARAPLVSLGADAYAVSTKLLSDKLTRGLYHLFLDPARTTWEERDRFLRYMGSAFEDYVLNLLRRVYPPQSHRLLDATTLRTRIHGKHCDAVILFGDSIVLIEAKATLVPLDVRAARNWNLFQRLQQDVLIDAADQLSATVDAIQNGTLRDEGVDPRIVRAYMPVVVTHDDIGMTRPIHADIVRQVADRGYLGQGGVLRFQAIAIGELEALEEDLHAGLSLYRLLSEKAALDGWRDDALRNYCYSQRQDLMNHPNAALMERFRELADGAIAFLREHQ